LVKEVGISRGGLELNKDMQKPLAAVLVIVVVAIGVGFVFVLNLPTASLNTPPTAPVVQIEPDPAYDDSALTCDILTASYDADGDSVTYTYSWLRNGAMTSMTANTVSADETATGDIWICVVTPFDGTDYGRSGNDSITIQSSMPANSPPTSPAVRIEPHLAYNHDGLWCNITGPSQDPDNDSITYEYAWLRNGAATLLDGDTAWANQTSVGDNWTCVVTPFDGTDYGLPGNDTITIQPYAPSGTFSLSPSIVYQCFFGLVDLFYTSFTFVDDGTSLIVQPAMNGGCFLTGTSAKNGQINVDCIYPGTCNEFYTLAGSFTSNSTWEATFTVSFTGMCSDCTSRFFSITGTRT